MLDEIAKPCISRVEMVDKVDDIGENMDTPKRKCCLSLGMNHEDMKAFDVLNSMTEDENTTYDPSYEYIRNHMKNLGQQTVMLDEIAKPCISKVEMVDKKEDIRMEVRIQLWNKSGRGPNGTMTIMFAEVNCMFDSIFDIYQNVETSKELCDTLEAKYMAEDASKLGSHLRIEESLRVQDIDKPKGNNVAGLSVVNMVEHNNSS
nr:zinc finger, CCHC-type [Tanacetum cinerariifolium]